MKKTILHIIHDLGRGGAETMLVNVVKQLNDYNNIIVTLLPQNHFKDELVCDKYYCLNIKSILFLPFAAGKLKKIIKENKVDIVHSHLFWPSILARIATPASIPLITTIHTSIATSIEYKSWYIKFLDKKTYGFRKNIIVAVSETALYNYFNFLKLKSYKSYKLYTFVDINIFNSNNVSVKKDNTDVFKLITVGALRQSKNYQFLIKAFKLLKNEKFQLDIYGEGPLFYELQKSINETGVNIKLKGEIKNLQNIINQYDLYVMSSTYEGFSLSVLEAMAMKMPLLLSDIKSFREQCDNTAIYFNLENANDFVEKLQALSADKNNLKDLGIAAHERAVTNFTLEQHMAGLRKIYEEVLTLN